MNSVNNYIHLWKSLDSSVEANLEFAQQVMQREPNNTKYFFGEYSYNILKWIAITVYSIKEIEISDYIYKLYGDYFEFVTNPIDDFNQPQWYQLKSYQGINGMKLKTWLMKNSHQFFSRKKSIQDKRTHSEEELIEFVDYEALLDLDDKSEGLSDEESIYRERLSNAWSSLSEKDKNILYVLVIQKLNWKDAFEELNEYIKPREGRQVIDFWKDKRKQDALALMKVRAVKHLIKRFNEKN